MVNLASLVEPVTYDRLATLRLFGLFAVILVIGFLLICALCIIDHRRRHRQDRASRKAWGKNE